VRCARPPASTGVGLGCPSKWPSDAQRFGPFDLAPMVCVSRMFCFKAAVTVGDDRQEGSIPLLSRQPPHA